ncbi:MAG: hypothetical protein DWP95_06835 [Proteobacteria bacterium]|nr:MAG: hypothetical protein DWP95_06835 [Pseudomonadota bacterium]
MKIRRKLRFLHRWLGLLTSLWVIQLAFTGLLLQQTDKLSLDKRYVDSVWLLEWFGYGQKTQAFRHQGEVIYQVDDRLLMADKVQRLSQTVHFAAKKNKLWLAATEQALYGLNHNNEVIWRLDDFDGLPTPLHNLHVDEHIWIKHNKQWYQINAQFVITPSAAPIGGINHAQKDNLTAAERQTVLPKTLSQVLSYDKVLADIHAGYKGSVWLNSLTALALLYLSMSGIIMFFKNKSKNRKSHL